MKDKFVDLILTDALMSLELEKIKQDYVTGKIVNVEAELNKCLYKYGATSEVLKQFITIPTGTTKDYRRLQQERDERRRARGFSKKEAETLEYLESLNPQSNAARNTIARLKK